jgi:hypothetical protein
MSAPLAYAVSIDDLTCIVFASTKPQARWVAVRSYWDAGYGSRRIWPSAHAIRRPDLDSSPLRNAERMAYAPEYVTPS